MAFAQFAVVDLCPRRAAASHSHTVN